MTGIQVYEGDSVNHTARQAVLAQLVAACKQTGTIDQLHEIISRCDALSMVVYPPGDKQPYVDCGDGTKIMVPARLGPWVNGKPQFDGRYEVQYWGGGTDVGEYSNKGWVRDGKDPTPNGFNDIARHRKLG
jgi:hypothetical protein